MEGPEGSGATDNQETNKAPGMECPPGRASVVDNFVEAEKNSAWHESPDHGQENPHEGLSDGQAHGVLRME